MAYPNSVVDTNAKQTRPPTLRDGLDGIFADAEELGGRLSAIADRVSGSVPSPVSEANPTPGSHMSVLNQIRSSLSALRDQVNRLDSVL
jgi:hypothetical protein